MPHCRRGLPEDFNEVAALLDQCGLPLQGLSPRDSRFWVARDEEAGPIVGCAALEFYPPDALLRSVAVHPDQRGRGIGQAIARLALDAARAAGTNRVYLLTETAGDFFPRLDFHIVERSRVPPQVARSLEFTRICPASAIAMECDLAETGSNQSEGRQPGNQP